MSEYRITLTDREVELAKEAAWMAHHALLPMDLFKAEQYKQLACRLGHTKRGGMPLTARKARQFFRMQANG